VRTATSKWSIVATRCFSRPRRSRRSTDGRRRVDPSANDNYAVRLAAEKGHLAIVERLLRDKRVDPSALDNYAVGCAAREGHLAVVERLLDDERVDPSADDNYAVRCAADNGHFTVVDRLLSDSRVDVAVAIQCSNPNHRKRFECRERLPRSALLCKIWRCQRGSQFRLSTPLVHGRHCRCTASGIWCAQSSILSPLTTRNSER
jgi:hypothetical protein